MLQICLRALPESLSFASLPKGLRRSFLSALRRVFLLVLLHPTRAGCLNCSFESPLYWFLLGNTGLALAARGQNYLPRQPTGLVGGQEHRDRRDVRGLPDAAEGRHGNHLLLEITPDSDHAGRASALGCRRPGLMEFTRICLGPSSFASTRVIA